MRIIDARFLKSATKRAEWPAPDGRSEIAFCGRSNVGKSSLLNVMLGRGGLARVSRTPGRTRLINFFGVTYLGQGGARGQFLCTDLPGFGYAEVTRTERQLWRVMMEEYFTRRENLRAVVLLCDGRRLADGPDRAGELLFDEIELANYLAELGRVVVPVLTKADKLSKSERKPAAALLSRMVHGNAVICSSLSGEGQGDVWRRLLRAMDGRTVAARAAREPGDGEEVDDIELRSELRLGDGSSRSTPMSDGTGG